MDVGFQLFLLRKCVIYRFIIIISDCECFGVCVCVSICIQNVWQFVRCLRYGCFYLLLVGSQPNCILFFMKENVGYVLYTLAIKKFQTILGTNTAIVRNAPHDFHDRSEKSEVRAALLEQVRHAWIYARLLDRRILGHWLLGINIWVYIVLNAAVLDARHRRHHIHSTWIQNREEQMSISSVRLKRACDTSSRR